MRDMNDFIRKGQTGESGNKGQFGSKRNTDADVSLTSAGTEPTEDQAARIDAEIERRRKVYPHEDVEVARGEITARIVQQEAAFEAWKRGETHPDDEAFDDIWEGKVPGVHGASVEHRLQEEKRRILRVVSLGQSSREYINESIRILELAVESRGKSLSVNQSAVYQRNLDQGLLAS